MLDENIESNQDSKSVFDLPVVPSKMHEKAMEKSRQEVKRQEAEHVIRMTLKAGVPRELIGWKASTFIGYTQSILDENKYKPPNKTRRDLAEYICDLKSGWTRKPKIIFVDGGTKETRVGFSKLILARIILGNFFNLGRLGVTLPYSMINLKFNSFDNDRQVFISNLLEIPALYIEEICENTGFKSIGDGAVMMDQLLDSRKTPTVISLSTQPEIFTGGTTYGSSFRDLLEAIKCVSFKDGDRFLRISIKQNKCPDIMTYSQQFEKKKK